MKKISLSILLVLAISAVYGQSRSYDLLRTRFADQPEVKSFKLNGALCRMIVNIIEHDDETVAAALEHVRHVRFITIPKEAFMEQGLTVQGFKGQLPKDNWELLADIKGSGDDVAFYHQLDKKSKDRYFVIIEDHDQVIALEMKGYIDPAIFNESATSSL